MEADYPVRDLTAYEKIKGRLEPCEDYLDTVVITLGGRDTWTRTKYTILEWGYALYFPLDGGFTKDWMAIYGESYPQKLSGTSEHPRLETDRTMLVTSHPVLVAIALMVWWRNNGRDELVVDGRVRIPSFYEAIEIIRNREVMNQDPRLVRGTIPGLLFHSPPAQY